MASDPKMFSMEWCMKMAGLEGDAEIGAGKMAADPALCSDCPPTGYPTDKTRCAPCPRRKESDHG